MFTGIIQQTAKVLSSRPSGGGLLVAIDKPKFWRLKAGDSVSVSGVCSTVTRVSPLEFFYMPETLDKTYLRQLKTGDRVNLERSLAMGERLDGHMVLGHVDTVGKIAKIAAAGQSKIFTIELSEPGKSSPRLLADKGSVAIDGVSLTVVSARQNRFTVSLIPFTLNHTNFSRKKAGDSVNVEFDVLAKYLAKLISR